MKDHHHATVLKECLEKNIIPKGLILEKTVNMMVSQGRECDRVNEQVQEILTDSSRKIMQVLAEYYDKAVVEEHSSFLALNDELAALKHTKD